MTTSINKSAASSGVSRLPRKLLLASAISMVLASGGTALAQDDEQQAMQELGNARHETQISTTYTLSPYLRAHDIEVTAMDGNVTLTGVVEEEVSKELAEEIAKGVPGVTSVDNQIEVQADYMPPGRDANERGFGDIVDDASITAAVKSKLLWSQYAEGFNTDVDTLNGKVTLRGSAESGAARELAAILAEDTQGVTEVDNQLVIEPSQAANEEGASGERGAVANAGQSISDTWITTKVKSTFMLSRNVSGSDISVNTSEGIVTLSGQVTDGAEKALAIERAKNIRGVKEVVSTDLTF